MDERNRLVLCSSLVVVFACLGQSGINLFKALGVEFPTQVSDWMLWLFAAAFLAYCTLQFVMSDGSRQSLESYGRDRSNAEWNSLIDLLKGDLEKFSTAGKDSLVFSPPLAAFAQLTSPGCAQRPEVSFFNVLSRTGRFTGAINVKVLCEGKWIEGASSMYWPLDFQLTGWRLLRLKTAAQMKVIFKASTLWTAIPYALTVAATGAIAYKLGTAMV